MSNDAPKSLRRLALPLIVSFTLRNLFSLVDLGFATSLENSKSAVAAIGYWIPFQLFLIAVWVGLSAGFTATLSLAFGLRREDLIGKLLAAISKILVPLISVLVLAGLALPYAIPYLQLEADLARDFSAYASVLALGFPLTAFWAILPDSIVKAHHDTRTTMVAGLLSTATNAVLNAVFVFIFGWGLVGIAIGTVLSRIPALVYASLRARKLECQRKQRWAHDAQHEPAASSSKLAASLAQPVRRILTLGFPSTFAFVLTAFEIGYVNRLLTALPDSTAMIAAWSVFGALLQLSLMPAIGSAIAILPWLARLVPEGRFHVVRRELSQVALLATLLALALTALPAFVFPEAIARRILSNDGQVDALGLRAAVSALQLLPLVALFVLPFLLLRTSFEALGRPKLALVASLLRFVVLSLPLLWLGRELGRHSFLGPIRGMALGMASAGLLASCFSAYAALRALRELEDALQPGREKAARASSTAP